MAAPTVTGDVQGVDPGFLAKVVQAAGAVGATQIRVTSGRRSPAENAQVGGASRSNHLLGHAIDGQVYIPGRGWVPIGEALLGVAGRFGLRSGDTPGFFNGRTDPVHVDDAMNQGGGGQSSTRGVPWQTEFLNLIGAPQTPANYKFLNQWAAREHNGGPALSDGSNNPFFTTAGAGGSVGPFKKGLFPSWNSIGVAKYPTLGIGVYVNAYHVGHEYPAITRALKSGNPSAFANDSSFQTELTAWSGGGYSGFSSIPQPGGPVGPTIDPAQMIRNVAGAVKGKPTSGGGGFIDDVTGAIVGGVEQGITSIPGVGAVIGAAGGVSSVVGGVESVGSFLGKLVDPQYILRGLQIVAGAGLVLTGTVLLVRQIALANDLPDPLQAVMGAVTKTGAPSAVPEDLSPKPVYSTKGKPSAQDRDGVPF